MGRRIVEIEKSRSKRVTVECKGLDNLSRFWGYITIIIIRNPQTPKIVLVII